MSCVPVSRIASRTKRFRESVSGFSRISQDLFRLLEHGDAKPLSVHELTLRLMEKGPWPSTDASRSNISRRVADILCVAQLLGRVICVTESYKSGRITRRIRRYTLQRDTKRTREDACGLCGSEPPSAPAAKRRSLATQTEEPFPSPTSSPQRAPLEQLPRGDPFMCASPPLQERPPRESPQLAEEESVYTPLTSAPYSFVTDLELQALVEYEQ